MMTNQQETSLELLLAERQLQVRLQPIVEPDADGYRVHALEGLIAGADGSGWESADTLFSAVRRQGVETMADRICIEQILGSAALLPGSPDISINVHASTLADDDGFVNFLVRTARAHGVALARLIVEIVEHSRAWDRPRLTRTVERLRRCRVRIAVDDIGSGDSNFRMVLETKPDYFKIDRLFTQGCSDDLDRRTVIETISDLASRFGGRAVAEGVESEADLAVVREAGISLVQGFLFSRPVAAAALTRQNAATVEELFPQLRNRSEQTPKAKEGAMSRKKILLVDDSTTVLMMEKMVLSKENYELVTARDGAEGVEVALREMPDLVLLDVIMPRMNGFETLRSLREHSITRTTPVIMVTTRGEAENVETGFATGCTDYVTKPINAVELLSKVKAYIGA